MTLIVRGAGNAEAAGKPPSGRAAHTEGSTTAATASYCHAEGISTTASGTSGAHAEGNTTTASGASAHAEGNVCTASGPTAHAEGQGTTASNTASHAEGNGTNASGANAHAEGSLCIASGSDSHAQGRAAVAHRSGQHAQAAGYFASYGDAQAVVLAVSGLTASATPLVLSALTAGGVYVGLADSSVLTLEGSRGFRFRIEAIARNTAAGAGEFAAWTITGTIVRGSTGSARILGTPVTVTDSDAGASTWTLGVSVNTTDATFNYLAVTATGEAAKTIRWVAAIHATEVG